MTGPADLSDDELVAHALAVHLLAGDDSEVYDACVAELWQRGTAAIRDRSLGLLTDARPAARALGADVLGRLGARAGTTHVPESVPPLVARLESEADPLVLDSIVGALGHLRDRSALPAVLSLAAHPSFRVRGSVARALPSLVEPGATVAGDDPVVAVLIALSADPDSEVRSWATFGVGTLLDVDGPVVRAALRARLTDADHDTRSEALVGLARRLDADVVPVVDAELRAGTVGRLAVEAARELATPELRPALEGLVGWWDVDLDLLEAALEACAPDR